MKFNKLNYRCIEDDYLSIKLLIDERPIEGLIAADNQAIPFYYFEKDILPKGYYEND